jgi:hypothetical protein
MTMTEKPLQTNVPPPPAPEILVRTLNSDAASVARGEIDPRPEIVGKETIAAAANGSLQSKKSNKTIKIVAIIGILIILLIIAYLILPKLFGDTVVTPQ